MSNVFDPNSPEELNIPALPTATAKPISKDTKASDLTTIPAAPQELPQQPDVVQTGLVDPRFAGELKKLNITTPDFNRPITQGFPGLYSNSAVSNYSRYVDSRDALAGSRAFLNERISGLEGEVQRQQTAIKSQTEFLRKQIEQKRNEGNTGFAGFLFGNGSNSATNRTVNPLTGEYGERGGGVLGALGYILGSIGSSSNAANAELFRGIGGQEQADKNFERSNQFARSIIYGEGTATQDSPLLHAEKQKRFYQGVVLEAGTVPNYKLPDGVTLEFAKQQVNAWQRVINETNNPFFKSFYRNVAADISNVGRYGQNVAKATGELSKVGRPNSLDPLRGAVAAFLPTNWAVGLNPFVNKPALNNNVAKKGLVRNVGDIITQGRQYDDTNNPYTKDGLFYDAERIKNGRDTYNDLQKIGSSLFASIVNPGESLSDAIFIERGLKPVLGYAFKKAFSFIPGKKTVLRTAKETTPEVRAIVVYKAPEASIVPAAPGVERKLKVKGNTIVTPQPTKVKPQNLLGTKQRYLAPAEFKEIAADGKVPVRRLLTDGSVSAPIAYTAEFVDEVPIKQTIDSTIIDVSEQKLLTGATPLPEKVGVRLGELKPKPAKIDADGFIVPPPVERGSFDLKIQPPEFGVDGALAVREAGGRSVLNRVEKGFVDFEGKPYTVRVDQPLLPIRSKIESTLVTGETLFAGEKNIRIPNFTKALTGATTSIGDYKEIVGAVFSKLPAFNRELYKISQATTKSELFTLVKKYTGVSNLVDLLAKTGTAVELAKPVVAQRGGGQSVIRRFNGGYSIPKLTALPAAKFDTVTIGAETLQRAVVRQNTDSLADVIATQRLTTETTRKFNDVMQSAAEYLGVSINEVKSTVVNDTIKSLVVSDVAKVSGLSESEVRRELAAVLTPSKPTKVNPRNGQRIPKSEGNKFSQSEFVKPFTEFGGGDAAGFNVATMLKAVAATMIDDVDVARLLGNANYEQNLKSTVSVLLNLPEEDVQKALTAVNASLTTKVDKVILDTANSELENAGSKVQGLIDDSHIVNLDLSRDTLTPVVKTPKENYIGRIKPEPTPFTYVVEENIPSVTKVTNADSYLNPKLNATTNDILQTLNDLQEPKNYTHTPLQGDVVEPGLIEEPLVPFGKAQDGIYLKTNEAISHFTDNAPAGAKSFRVDLGGQKLSGSQEYFVTYSKENNLKYKLSDTAKTNPAVNLITTTSESPIPSTTLIGKADVEATLNVSVTELAKVEQKTEAIKVALQLTPELDVIPNGDVFNITIRGREDVVIELGGNKLSTTIDGVTVNDSITTENVNKLLELNLNAKPQSAEEPRVLQLISNAIADSVDNLEIEVPAVVKITDPVRSPKKLPIPGDERAIRKIEYGVVQRSDSNNLTLITGMLEELGVVPVKVNQLGFSTKVGVLTSREISALPKAVLADLLPDLQAIQLQIIDGLDTLNNANFPAVAIVREGSTDYMDDVAKILSTVPESPVPLPKLASTDVNVIVVSRKPGKLGFHGTAVRNWEPVRNVVTESINSLGFGTYVTTDSNYAKSAANRFYGNDFSSTRVDLGKPSVHLLENTAPLRLIDAESTILPASVKKYMKQFSPGVDLDAIFKANNSTSVKRLYSKIIDASVDNGVIDPVTSRSLLALMDNYLVEHGFQGIRDTANGTIKLMDTNNLTTRLAYQVPFNPLDKHELLDTSFNSLKVSSRQTFDNVLDFSRAVDDKFEVLKQANAVLDDQIKKATQVRVAIANGTDLIDDTFYGAKASESAVNSSLADAEFMDDIQNLGARIDPTDLCDY
jgi:hypothetical protein